MGGPGLNFHSSSTSDSEDRDAIVYGDLGSSVTTVGTCSGFLLPTLDSGWILAPGLVVALHEVKCKAFYGLLVVFRYHCEGLCDGH